MANADKIGRAELFDETFLRRLRGLAISARRIVAAARGGAHRATDLGDGLEFADHRDYSPGDELRYVDWNVFGRLDRLQIRLFHRHSEQQIHLLLDCTASMAAGRPSKQVFAKRLAAALAYLARANLDHVAISPWRQPGDGPPPRELAPVRGRSSRFASILDYLAELPMDGPGSLADAARRWTAHPRPRGLAVLISDCPDPDDLKIALRRLARAGQQVAVMQVYSPADEGRLPPGPLAIVDPETPGPALRVTHDAALADAYRRLWDAHLAHVRAAVHAANGVHTHAPSDASWEKFLLATLRRIR